MGDGEGLCDDDPMADVDRPQRPELLTPVLSDDEVRAMFATCGGDFDGVRDLALMRFLLTTGCRRSECAGITLDDLDLRDADGQGDGQGPPRTAGPRRGRHRPGPAPLPAGPPAAPEGGDDRSGCGSASSARSPAPASSRSCSAAPNGPASTRANPHAWRHAFAHRWLSAGGTEGGLMSEAGWRISQMVRRYARSAAAERGRAEHARLNIGDGL